MKFPLELQEWDANEEMRIENQPKQSEQSKASDSATSSQISRRNSIGLGGDFMQMGLNRAANMRKSFHGLKHLKSV